MGLPALQKYQGEFAEGTSIHGAPFSRGTNHIQRFLSQVTNQFTEV